MIYFSMLYLCHLFPTQFTNQFITLAKFHRLVDDVTFFTQFYPFLQALSWQVFPDRESCTVDFFS